MVDLLFVSWNRLAYTQHSFRALLANTDWSLVSRLVLADDASTDGTREWLEEATNGLPATFSGAIIFPPAPFRGPVEAVNRYLDALRSPNAEFVAKIDCDTVVPPGWLPELLGLLERHPDVDLLGMQADLGPPRACPYPARTVRYAPFVDGNGLWRLRAFDGKRRPQRTRSDPRYGFTQWQEAHSEVVKAWATPDLPVFQLDNLPFEPWLTLGREYVAAGWQRGWPNAPYSADATAYWSWWTDSLVAA